MRLASFASRDRAGVAVVVGDGLIDLRSIFGDEFPDLRTVLERDALGRVAKAVPGAQITHALTGVQLLPPVTNPDKIFCVGVNYLNRNDEYRDASGDPKYPSIFMRSIGSLAGHEAPILRPPESEQLDYEGEIAIVIGKRGRRIPEEAAHRHIAGLTCMNEGTIRDWVRHGKFNVTQGKNFARSGAIGPWLVTVDEFESLYDLHVTTRVNGEVRQADTTASMLFPFSELIRYISTFAELLPGDIIATGTPTGAGARLDPPRYLKPGDVVEVEVQGVGALRNPVADEAHDALLAP
jgi:2-keto-4-pentenoate hydratase/2-oxohepta-3-ene-1,7-dioic acid hydratase in catechol pathway